MHVGIKALQPLFDYNYVNIIPSKKTSPDIQKICDDKSSYPLLSQIFACKMVRDVWMEIQAISEEPPRIIALKESECSKIGLLSNTAECQLEYYGNKIHRITIYYNKEVSEREAKLSLIVEIMNAFFQKEHLDVTVNMKHDSRSDYAKMREKIEWIAHHFALAIVDDVIPEGVTDYRFNPDFDRHLKVQRESGHMAAYERQYDILKNHT